MSLINRAPRRGLPYNRPSLPSKRLSTSNPADPSIHDHLINGSTDDLLDRFAISELCRHFTASLDAHNFPLLKALFWQGGDASLVSLPHHHNKPLYLDPFILLLQQTLQNGHDGTGNRPLLHRECGTVVELGTETTTHRAVARMRATILSRRYLPTLAADGQVHREVGVEIPAAAERGGGVNGGGGGGGGGAMLDVDIEQDVQLVFFCRRDQRSWGWKICHVACLELIGERVVSYGGGAGVRAATMEEMLMSRMKQRSSSECFLGKGSGISAGAVQFEDDGVRQVCGLVGARRELLGSLEERREEIGRMERAVGTWLGGAEGGMEMKWFEGVVGCKS